MNTTAELDGMAAELLSLSSEAFRPCAYFDERLDCIRVITRDCSTMEERISDRLTVLVDNYAADDKDKYVGFTIKGARHFLAENEIPWAQSVHLKRIVNALLATFPSPISRAAAI